MSWTTCCNPKKDRSQKTRERYESAVQDPGFNSIRNLPLIHTTAETLYKVLKDSRQASHRICTCTAFTALRLLGWLARPIIGYNQWPKLRLQRTAGRDAGRTSAARERGNTNDERRAFLELFARRRGPV